MSSANLTMIGIYNFDSTIFDGLLFPAGINKDTAVNEILSRCGEFEILYPNISFLKQMITHWGNKHYRTFDKWIKALEIEFEPLYNYDRYEEYLDEKINNGNVTSKSNSKDNTTNQNSNSIVDSAVDNKSDNVSENEHVTERGNSASQTNTDSNSNETDTRSVSAYDSATYQPREQEVKSINSSQSGNGAAQNENDSEKNRTENINSNLAHNATSESQGNAASSSENNTESNTNSNNTEHSKHTAHLYGNIGVTTSTQMLEDYIRVERFNIYEQIADIFVDEFCLMVY